MSDPTRPSQPASAHDPERTVLAPTRPGSTAAGPATDDDRTLARSGAPGAAAAAPAAAPVAVASSNVLPVGKRLDEFEITGVVGEGGFGIVYRAYDHALQRVVALKEYMPSSMAARQTDASVAVKSDQHRETFEIGLKSFINEARLLAAFDHPALVKVLRFWAAHGTAYMAMPLYEGGTLKQALKAMAQPPDEAWLRQLLLPLLDAIELLHEANTLHRDIAPDNVLLALRNDGSRQPLLLDFGAARRVIGGQTQALTVILKPGFAPIEQYDEIPGMKQGAWTDLYALGAVIHFAICGRAPPPSVGRLVRDSMVPLAQAAAGRYSAPFLAAIDRALAPQPEARVQSVAELRRLLLSEVTTPAAAAPQAAPQPIAPESAASQPSARYSTAAQPAAPHPTASQPTERAAPRAPAEGPATAARPQRARAAAAIPANTPARGFRWGRVAIGGVALGGLFIVAMSVWVNLDTRRVEQRTAESSRALAEPPRLPARTVEQPALAPASPAAQAGPPPAAGAVPGVAPVAVPAAVPASDMPRSPAQEAARDASRAATIPPPRASPPASSPEPARTVNPLVAATNPAGTTQARPAPSAGAAPAEPDDPVDAPAPIRAGLREARQCFADGRYTCTIERSQAVLSADPQNLPAQRLLRLAREAQDKALQGDWKMR